MGTILALIFLAAVIFVGYRASKKPKKRDEDWE